MSFEGISIIAVIVAAVAAFGVGAVWYAALFPKQWLAAIGKTEAEIDRASLPGGARVICFNCPVTLDYRADRLNVELGPDGKVANLRCG